MLELEELAGAVGRFAEGDDAGLADDRRQRPQVVVALAGDGGTQRHLVAAQPAHHLRGRRCEARGVERQPLVGAALGDLGLDRLGDEVRRVEHDLVLAGGQAEVEAAGAVELAVEEAFVLGAEAVHREAVPRADFRTVADQVDAAGAQRAWTGAAARHPRAGAARRPRAGRRLRQPDRHGRGAGGRWTPGGLDRADQVDAAGAQREFDGRRLLADGERRREDRGETGGARGHPVPAFGDGDPEAAVAAGRHDGRRAAGAVGDQRHPGTRHRPPGGIRHLPRDRHRRRRPHRLDDHREIAHPGRPVAREQRAQEDDGCVRRHVHLDLDPRPGGGAVNAAVHHVVEDQGPVRPVHPRPQARIAAGDAVGLDPPLEPEMLAARRLDREAGGGDAECLLLHDGRAGPPCQAQAPRAAGGTRLLRVDADLVAGAGEVPFLAGLAGLAGGEGELGARDGRLGRGGRRRRRRGRRGRRSGLGRTGLGGCGGEEGGWACRQRHAGEEARSEERQASRDPRSCTWAPRFGRHGGTLLSGTDRSRG